MGKASGVSSRRIIGGVCGAEKTSGRCVLVVVKVWRWRLQHRACWTVAGWHVKFRGCQHPYRYPPPLPHPHPSL